MSIPITITGNVTGDPELRFLQSGIPTATFTVAVSKRVKDGDGWKDGPTSFVRCTAWRQLAENVAESIAKGTRVIVVGSMAQRDYETKEGEKRTVWDCTVDEVGPSLRYAQASVKKVERAIASPQPDDPWADSAPF